MKILLLVFVIFWSINSYADLAKAKSCNVNKDDECDKNIFHASIYNLFNVNMQLIKSENYEQKWMFR